MRISLQLELQQKEIGSSLPEIGRSNAEQLNARIANEAWPSDLRPLALIFDDVLAGLARLSGCRAFRPTWRTSSARPSIIWWRQRPSRCDRRAM
jgi:hypothetical protein